MKKLCKVLLVFVLIAATFSSSLLSASAVENNDLDHDEHPFGDNTSPCEIITDEVDDSTIINGDGGGTGSGNNAGSDEESLPWIFDGFSWFRRDDGSLVAAADYHCDKGLFVHEAYGFAPAEVTEHDGVYTATISASRSLDKQEHTEIYSHEHTFEFKGFEWAQDDDGLKAYALYYCPDNSCKETREVQATVTRIKSQPQLCKATVSAAQSYDGEEHVETRRIAHDTHEWIFDGFRWDFSDYDWTQYKGAKAFAVYHCRYERTEQCIVPAFVNGDIYPWTLCCLVKVSSEQAPDGEEHTQLFLATPIYGWVFDGFEWDTTDSVKAYAVYHNTIGVMQGQECRAPAIVTRVAEAADPTFTAEIAAEASPDNHAYSETKTFEGLHFHEYSFRGFEWDLTNFTAKALFECSCGEQHRVDADMSYPCGNVAKAYVSKYVTPDHEAHEESRIVDFGDYVPYTWNIDGYYEFIGFEWTGTKADACYYYYKRVGCGTFAKEVVKVPAVVTRLTITVIPQYKARIAAWQTPDGVEHTEIKTIITPFPLPDLPDPVPVTPIVGPIEKREINPNLVIWPIGELTPANP